MILGNNYNSISIPVTVTNRNHYFHIIFQLLQVSENYTYAHNCFEIIVLLDLPLDIVTYYNYFNIVGSFCVSTHFKGIQLLILISQKGS